jgi:hypothetical protein
LEGGAQADASKSAGGVMDIFVALLLLVSVGVFAAHVFDALRAR